MEPAPSDEPTSTRLSQLPTWLLSQAAARSHRVLTTALAEAGARGYHYRILTALKESGPASQVAVGTTTGMDRSDVHAAVSELVDRGALTRSADPTDGRRNQIALTRTGRRLLRVLDRVVDDVQEQVLAPLSTSERSTLVKLLARISPDTGRVKS